MTWRAQAPGDVLDQVIDFTRDLLPGEILTAATATAQPPGLVISGVAAAGAVLTLRVCATSPLTGYVVTSVAGTSQGRQVSRTEVLWIGRVGLDDPA